MGIKLAPRALHQLATNPKSLELVYPDLVKMSAKMKHMDIISHAEGAALCIQSKKMKGEEGGTTFSHASHLLYFDPLSFLFSSLKRSPL